MEDNEKLEENTEVLLTEEERPVSDPGSDPMPEEPVVEQPEPEEQPEEQPEEEPEEIPDPEPDPTLWAVTDTSVRAISSEDELGEGEELVIGERPLGPEQKALAILQKSQLLTKAAEMIGPLQNAVDLEMATAEEEDLLKKWKKYTVLVNRLDISTAPDISWPPIPE